MEFTALGSGSDGNAFAVRSADGATVLIDAGFSCRELCARLTAVGIAPESVRAVLLTHDHSWVMREVDEGRMTPEEAARRELYEESGVTRAELLPVCDYYAFDSEGESNGRVFAARVLEREALPEYEMQKVQAFECLPEDLTYPRVTPVLFREAAERLRAVEP